MSVVFPKLVRDNDWFRKTHPEIVATAEGRTLSKLWAKVDESVTNDDRLFNECMEPYLSDPFRGAVERRVLDDDQRIIDLEYKAVQNVLDAANITPESIDLVLCNDMVAEQMAYGNAVHLAKKFKFKGPALNIESTCSSTLQGMKLAHDLLQSGNYDRILLVMGTANSRQLETSDTLSWFVGDGVVSILMENGHGICNFHSTSTHDTLDMFKMYNMLDKQGSPCLRTKAHRDSGTMARTTAGVYLRECVKKVALDELSYVDWFVFHTASAMYADFSAKALNVPTTKYHSQYPRFANVGSCNVAYNLTQAVLDGKVTPGQQQQEVVLYSVGSSSTACAIRYMMTEKALFLPFDYV